MTEKKAKQPDLSSPEVDPKDAARIEEYGYDSPDESDKKKDS